MIDCYNGYIIGLPTAVVHDWCIFGVYTVRACV